MSTVALSNALKGEPPSPAKKDVADKTSLPKGWVGLSGYRSSRQIAGSGRNLRSRTLALLGAALVAGMTVLHALASATVRTTRVSVSAEGEATFEGDDSYLRSTAGEQT